MPQATNEQLEDGWTRVRSKKGAPRAPQEMRTTGIPPPSKDLTLDKLISNFDAKMKIWQRSSARKEVLKMLDREQPDEGWDFDKAVCLASGSFSRDNWENSKRSMFQFVVFLDTVRHLGTEASNPIKIYAQDPMYTDLDKDFLSYYNVNVLAVSLDEMFLKRDLGPVKDHLGPRTIVFELFMDMGPERMRELFESDLQVHVGSPFKTWLLDEKLDVAKLRNRRKKEGWSEHSIVNAIRNDQMQCTLVGDFQKRHRSLYFPRFEEDPNIFEGLMFHWKIPTDDDEG